MLLFLYPNGVWVWIGIIFSVMTIVFKGNLLLKTQITSSVFSLRSSYLNLPIWRSSDKLHWNPNFERFFSLLFHAKTSRIYVRENAPEYILLQRSFVKKRNILQYTMRTCILYKTVCRPAIWNPSLPKVVKIQNKGN